MQNDKLEKLKKLLEITNDGLTRKDFTDSFKVVLDHLFKTENILADKLDIISKEIKTSNDYKIIQQDKRIEQLLPDLTKAVSDALKDISVYRSELETLFISSLNKQNETLKIITDKAESIRDGKDADEEKIVKDVLKKFKMPDINIEDIENLREELDKLKEVRGRVVGGGGTSAAGVRQTFKWIAHTEEPVGLINGTNKVFTVLNDIWWIAGFTLNGEQIAELPNFTVSGKTITFTTAIPIDYAGKDFEIKYIG